MFATLRDNVRLQAIRVKTLAAYRNGEWKNRVIHDNGEPLAEIASELCLPYYHRVMHLTDDPRIFVRKTLHERFMQAHEKLLSQGYRLVAYDGWRSLELQDKLFWYYMRHSTVPHFGQAFEQAFFAGIAPEDTETVKKNFARISHDARICMIEANRMYVSVPSKNPGKPSPHATGGALDVWLHDMDNNPVNLGVPFDYMKEEAGTFYHLKQGRRRFPGDKKVVRARRCLILAMVEAGFTAYGPEVWHFNYGNQMDALVKGTDAQYGYIEP